MTKKNSLKRKLVADWKATKFEKENPARIELAEAKAKANISQKYLKKKRRFFRALLEDVETKWFWSEDELRRFEHMWTAGYPLADIVRLLPAKPHEVALLIVDAEMRGAIKARPGGHMGAADPSLQTEPIEGRLYNMKMRNYKGGTADGQDA